MDRAEAVDQQALKAKEEMAQQEAALEAALIKVETTEADIDRELEVLSRSHEQLVRQLDEKLLKRYEQMRSSHSDRPMVPVKGARVQGANSKFLRSWSLRSNAARRCTCVLTANGSCFGRQNLPE